MQRRVPEGETTFEQLVHALPPDWEEMMRNLGAFTYAGKIQSPAELLRALFLYGGPDQSLREVAGTLTLQAARITDQAVWKRLQRCAPFLKALVKRMLPLDTLPPVPQSLRFLACDGTTVQRPGATSSDYRLHLVINLVTLGLHEVQVTETKTGESLKQYRLQAGDVMVGDQGYCSYAGILHTVEQQHADVLVRWNHQRALYDPDDPKRALDFCTILKTQAPGTIVSRPVVLKYAETSKTKDPRMLSGTLHIYRMQEKEAQAARKKVSKKHQKLQRKLSAKTLFLRQFVLVFTSVSSHVLCGETALALYRCRWQIELAIKRMKSLLHIDKLRTKQRSKLAEVYLYSKIIYQLLVDHAMRTTFGAVWGSLDQARQGTWWRFYKLLKARFDAILRGQWTWEAVRVRACFHVLMERPRKRKLQCLPRRVVEHQQRLNVLLHAA
jgi:Transposase DDE domain